MARTTPALVAGIISVEEDIDLTPFITTANILVTRVCTYLENPYTDDGVDSQMEVIERWLAAHYYAIFDAQLVAAKAGTVNVVYQTKIHYGLMLTHYGQQAMMLDTNGGLAALENVMMTRRKVKIDISWLGTPPGEFPLELQNPAFWE